MVEKHLNYCEEDCIDSVDRLKGHLLKCKKLPRNIRDSLKIQDPDSGSNNVQLDKSDVNSILARFFNSADIPFTAVENPFGKELMDAVIFTRRYMYCTLDFNTNECKTSTE